TANAMLTAVVSAETPPVNKRKILYCPGVQADVTAENDQLWNRGANVIIGYTWVGWRTDWDPDRIHNAGGGIKLMAPSSVNAPGETQRLFVTKTTATAPGMNISSTELVVDVTPSLGTPPGPFSYTDVPNSGMGMTSLVHSGHMEKGVPGGGN